MHFGDITKVEVRTVTFEYDQPNKKRGTITRRTHTSAKSAQEIEELKVWLQRHSGSIIKVSDPYMQERSAVFF